MKTLIIGVDSFIGRSVSGYLGTDTVGTTRRKENTSPSVLHFDLATPKEQWPDFPHADCAFIAAAISRQPQCAQDPEHAEHINVHQTTDLINLLTDKGAHVVFPSTNIVLECTQPMQKIDATPAPQGIYAKGKARVEETFKNNPNVTIARLPKILDSRTGLIKEWKEKLTAGEKIKAYKDMYISPVSLAYATHFITELLDRKPGGIWHLSGDCEISYYDLACAMCDRFQLKYDYVEEQFVEKEAAFATPEHPSLNCSVTHQELGIAAQSVDNMLEELLVPDNEH